MEELFHAADSDEDSFAFPDSTIDIESEIEEEDHSAALLKRMEASKAFHKLYRTGSDGKLLQVVRRKDFQPLSSRDMAKIKLTQQKNAGSPLLPEREIQQTEEKWHFRYHYWEHFPKKPVVNSREMRMRRTVSGLTREKMSTRGQHFPMLESRGKLVQTASRVGRVIPSADKLPQTARDLGLDMAESQLVERFKAFNTPTQGRTGTSGSKGNRTAKKQQREGVEVQTSVPLFNPDEFRRERILTEQAKSLFMSGAFSKLYNEERESADREMLRWIKYA